MIRWLVIVDEQGLGVDSVELGDVDEVELRIGVPLDKAAIEPPPSDDGGASKHLTSAIRLPWMQ